VDHLKRFKDILFVVEAGQGCKPALARAVALAESNHACLTVVDVVEGFAVNSGIPEGLPSADDLETAMTSSHEQDMQALVEPYRTRIEIQTKLLKGTPFLEIIGEVLRNGRDLVIKIPEPQNWLDRLFGSADMHLLRKCPCPVWIIKLAPPKSYRRILAAVDVDQAHPPGELKSRYALNRQILEMAASLALSEFAELHIVQAWHAVGETIMSGSFSRTPKEKVSAYVEQVRWQHATHLDALMGEVTDKLGPETVNYLKPRTHLVKGAARKEIPALAKRIEADLVVMGTVGRTGIPGFIVGNTAEMILSQINCSVLAIKPPGFLTPITVQG
jgi:universal stress protein E